jgi:hypothetical protein
MRLPWKPAQDGLEVQRSRKYRLVRGTSATHMKHRGPVSISWCRWSGKRTGLYLRLGGRYWYACVTWCDQPQRYRPTHSAADR